MRDDNEHACVSKIRGVRGNTMLYVSQIMENLLNLIVKTTKADYDAFYAHTASKVLKPYAWIPMFKNLCLWLVLAFSFMSFFQFQSGGIEKKLFFSVLTLSVSFFIYVTLSKFMEVKIAQCFAPNENGIMVGPKEFEILPEGIKEVHPYGYNFYNWDIVEKIEEVNGSIFVYVDKVLALIFNPQAFESADTKEDFLKILNKYV